MAPAENENISINMAKKTPSETVENRAENNENILIYSAASKKRKYLKRRKFQ